MTLFEYIAVAASLICSFVAVRILGGVAAVLRSGERYWVHAAWIFLQLWLLSVQWWLFWAYRDVEWSYGRFILALTPLGLLYLLSAILIPANVDQVVSWRQYYFDNRVRFFGISLATLLVMISNTVVLLGHPVFQSRRVIPLSLGVLIATALISDSPRVHAALTLVFGGLLLAIAVTFARPASFGVAP